ncbi:hypothetical protein HY631_04340 [Candidatus Uhrbacteria bacterium]|nr:hypothetical protein [Candidatus Uhrbacteria bacterium]
MNPSTWWVATAIPALALPAACGGSGREIAAARQLAENAQVDLAVKKLEGLITADPELRDAYIALGDIRLQAGLASNDASAENKEPEALFAAAARAYDGALKLGDEDQGLVLAKRSLTLISSDREAAQKAAEAAWTCCSEFAALSAVGDDLLVGGLRTWDGQVGPWAAHPIFAASPVAERMRFVVRAGGAHVLPLDADTPSGGLPPFSGGKLTGRDDSGYGTFVDVFNPVFEAVSGWVYRDWCPGRWCVGGSLNAPPRAGTVRSRPYYFLENPPVVSLSGVDTGGIRCVAGSYTSNTCKVSFRRKQTLVRRVSLDSLWLVPTADVDSPAEAIEWSHDAGKIDVRDHLAAGDLATGLPEPLVRWAWPESGAEVRTAITEREITTTIDATVGTFVVTNGILTSWVPKPFDRDANKATGIRARPGDE